MKITKRHLIPAMARNLRCLMRRLFGRGAPRGSQKSVDLLAELFRALDIPRNAAGRLLGSIGSHPASCDAVFIFNTDRTVPAAA